MVGAAASLSGVTVSSCHIISSPVSGLRKSIYLAVHSLVGRHHVRTNRHPDVRSTRHVGCVSGEDGSRRTRT